MRGRERTCRQAGDVGDTKTGKKGHETCRRLGSS
jgi:hypothetical protein